MPEIIISGPEGRLEGRYHHSKNEKAPVAIILHPHPQHGGTMNNKIVYQLYYIFVRKGFSVLRFNFRGVSRSQGAFDNGPGELADAAAALDWMQSINPNAPCCWVAGFSFGAWIGMQLLMRRPEVEGFLSIAPPANMYDFAFLAPCPSSGIIVQGTNDDVVPEPSVEKLFQKLSQQKNIIVDYQLIKGANHFFKGHMEELLHHLETYLAKRLAAGPRQKPVKRR